MELSSQLIRDYRVTWYQTLDNNLVQSTTSKFLHCLLVPSEPVQLLWSAVLWPPRDIQTLFLSPVCLCGVSCLPFISISIILILRMELRYPSVYPKFSGLVKYPLRPSLIWNGNDHYPTCKLEPRVLGKSLFFDWSRRRILETTCCVTWGLGLYYCECFFHDELLWPTDVHRHVHSWSTFNICVYKRFLAPMRSLYVASLWALRYIEWVRLTRGDKSISFDFLPWGASDY